jgi:hypothetical protein
LLSSLPYQLYTTPAPEIPNTNTLHYINRHTPKHAQGSQTPAASIPLPYPPASFPAPSFYLALPLSVTQTSISSLTTITPNSTVYYQGVFYIICKQLVWH